LTQKKKVLFRTAKKMAGNFKPIKKLTGTKSVAGDTPGNLGGPYKAGSLKSDGTLYGPKSTGRPSVAGNEIFKDTFTKQELERVKISSRIDENLAFLKRLLGASSDFIVTEIQLKENRVAVLYMDGLAKEDLISKHVINPLHQVGKEKENKKIALEYIKNQVIDISNVREIQDMHQVVDSLLYGGTVVLLDGECCALSHAVQGWDARRVEEPINESAVRGPREGFTETLRTNISLLRRKLRTPNLVIEQFILGETSHTGVAVAYIKGVASPDLVKEVRSRLKRIKIDSVQESAYLEEFIEDNPYSPFPQVMRTERPDKVAGFLIEGRVAILTDNTPFVMAVPAEFNQFLQSFEDYYERYFIGSALRVLRYITFFISLTLPSFYVALTTFHQEMIPLQLLTRIAASREGVPFPALVEALLMEFAFEVLREAGVRLPRVVGQAISIVGALVIGDAAVRAGIVSPAMVIVVALTGIASFTIPAFNFAITARFLRFLLIFLAASLGLFGVMAGLIAILIHLAGLRTFGMPYLAPFTPFHPTDFKDVLVRVPRWEMDERPEELSKENEERQDRGLKPASELP